MIGFFMILIFSLGVVLSIITGFIQYFLYRVPFPFLFLGGYLLYYFIADNSSYFSSITWGCIFLIIGSLIGRHVRYKDDLTHKERKERTQDDMQHPTHK